jgi:hypothetical protein
MRTSKLIVTLGAFILCCVSQAQIPDLLNAFDAGGRSLGMGGALHGSDPSSMSAYYNPASLGYITKTEVDLALHNLQNSETVIGNTYANPSYHTHSLSGTKAVTDVGVSVPVKPLFGNGKASVALNYNVGGYVHDVAQTSSNGFPDGSLTLTNYQLLRSIETDFITLAYGQSIPSRTFSFGFGLMYAQTGTNYDSTGSAVDSNGNAATFSGSNINYQAHGLGFIVGGQFIPATLPNFSLGLSYRSAIGLDAGTNSGIYDRVPARALANATYRIGGAGHGDYGLVGVQYQYFFDGDASADFDRKGQSVLGLGAEYDHQIGSFTIPLRIGLESASAGGDGYEYRRVFTYGIGLRPSDSRYSLDFNWSTMDGGGKDFGISAGYRFGK